MPFLPANVQRLNAIETEALSKEYTAGWRNKSAFLALDQLNLQVEKGLIYGFLGPNGAGKSTTIKLLLGLITPTRGSGFLMGTPIYDKRARERVGFLPEDPSFCPYLRAREFLDLCGKVLHMDRAARQQRIPETLEMVGLASKAETKISEFSRGMMQRIGLAQALLNLPDLVVLDEPLNGLDPYGRKELKSILMSQRKLGKTVFFSSHILSDVEEMCDHVGILNRGRMISHGSLKGLLPVKYVTLQVNDLKEETLEHLEDMTSSINRTHHHWMIQLSDASRKEEVISILRREGNNSSIEVQSRNESLEEFFFRRIEEDNQERGLIKSVEPAPAPQTVNPMGETVWTT